ncbi:related to RTM1 protein [Cephalotrichum gorgonifer]|uniref:Related to RTM1 protein n=1 Tax=Cephalotrichum gorgonifer TaxID=2041049 RepID=A0AAE8T096_9PEZI|nr:related to RTM1 protein [Cephalotrichum gorgonifer]
MAGSFKLYDYSPSGAAAMIFVAAFTAATLWHAFVVFQKRSWYFCAFLVGGIFEITGYVARFISSSDETNILPFVLQSIFILVAPALFAASVYMILGRLILYLGAEELSPVRPRWLTKIFVGGDVLSFLVQVLGSGMLSNAKTTGTGQTVILVGLVIQILFFGVFIIATVIFHRRYVQSGMDLRRGPQPRHSRIGWKQIILVQYLASGLIFIRSLFRLIEYAQGKDGVLMTSEVFLYLFDSVLMLGVMVALLFYHPTKLLPRKKDMMALRDMDSQ